MKIHSTRNIKFCAYLLVRKIHPLKVEKFSPGRAIYKYELAQEDWDKLQLEFNKSNYLDYANCLDAIKDLAY